ncbi:MAG: molecular chaperone TorD family protein [Bryobacteraceae bacterium]
MNSPGGAFYASVGKAFLVPEPGHESEYVRLFLSPAGAPCPPWQSVYGPAHQLLGPEHHSALDWYRRYGVEPAAATEPADHAGLLLLFYAQLLENEVPAGERDRFRRQHLAWIPEWCGSVARETADPLFQTLARSTAEALALSD